MFKKLLTIGGVECPYHTVHHFEVLGDGTCVASLGAFCTVEAAAIGRNPVETFQLRCDGVTPGEDILQQIYSIAAADPRYAGAEGLLPDSKYGLEHPRLPLPIKPEQPSPWHIWDKATWAWVITPDALLKAKAEAKVRINMARDAAERAPFPAFGKLFDATDKAIQRLLGASQAALIAKQSGQVMDIEWTCADNSTINLSTDDLIQLPIIMATHADMLHQKARTLKTEIDSATELNEVLTVVW